MRHCGSFQPEVGAIKVVTDVTLRSVASYKESSNHTDS